MRESFAILTTNSQHEATTDDLIGCCVPSIHANYRTKWVKFRKVKGPDLRNNSSAWGTRHIHATHILIEERISTLSTLVRKSVRDFQSQMKKYAADVTERVK